jgi:hypothetical protein
MHVQTTEPFPFMRIQTCSENKLSRVFLLAAGNESRPPIGYTWGWVARLRHFLTLFLQASRSSLLFSRT